jgi:ribonuclease P protein subunit POP4
MIAANGSASDGTDLGPLPTAETLTRHELTGLPLRVADASDTGLVGREGRVVRETTKTLVMATDAGSAATVTVPKAGTTLVFRLPEGPVTVEGDRLVARPARRSERGGDSRWR